MIIRCLGVVGVSHPDGAPSLSRSQRHIVALLTAAGPRGLSSASFADELYRDDLPEQWEASVRQAISRLRKALGAGVIATRNGRYAFDLDHDSVDVWKLLAADDIDLDQESEKVLQQLLADDPFADIEPSPLLLQTLEPIATARVRLIERMAEGTRPWSAVTLQATRTLVARCHYRDDPLVNVLELHRKAGRNADALVLADAAASFLRDELDADVSPRAAQLVERLSNAPAPATQDVARNQSGRVVGMYEASPALGMIERVDLTAGIVDLLGAGGVVLDGDSGAGKSALVKGLVPRLAASGQHVLWLVGRRGAPTAYEPIIAAVPALEDELGPLLGDGGDPLQRSQCWSAARRRLLTEFNDLPLVIVVDDAQWLDSHSHGFVTFLASSQGADAPRILAIGRDETSPRWADFADGLERAGLQRLHVDPFDRDELITLVGLHHRNATSKQRQDFADSLMARKAALAAVAHELTRTADPATLAIATPRPGAQPSEIWVSRVGHDTQRVAATAAVLGMRFRIPALAQLAGLEVAAVVDSTDQMLNAGLLIAEQRPDEFSFRHVLIHADFDAVLDRGERRRLHLDASELASAAGDVHARARHLVEAGALIDNSRLIDALLQSAHTFKDKGLYREAVEAFTRARQYCDTELAVDDLLSFASAVASSGGDGWELRSAAFDEALSGNYANDRLDIALTDVLENEDVTGDPRRVKMLKKIDAEELTPTRRAMHAAALGRELGLLGQHDEAVAIATAAVAAATSPNDRFIAWLGSWATCRSWPVSHWPVMPPDAAQVNEPELIGRLTQVATSRALLAGDLDVARERFAVFESHHFTQSQPLRSWHVSLTKAMLAFVEGRWHDHRQLADAGFTAAADDGINAAFSARAAQEFMVQWIEGRHGDLLPQLQDAPPDLQSSLLAQAAQAVTLAEHDAHRDQATELITELTDLASSQRTPFAHPAAAVLASAPSACVTESTRRELYRILLPFLGTALIAGASIAHLGPASWSLARVAEADEQLALLQRACREADDWHLPLWSVQCRLGLAAVTQDGSLVTEAASLAAGTSLEALIPT